MNGYCRNDYMCPFAHGLNDLHRIMVKTNQQIEPDYAAKAGQFLSSILKSLQQVFSNEDTDKKELIKKGLQLVEQKDLHHAD